MQITVYRRRTPEESILHQVVRDHLDEFLERADARAGGRRRLPKYVCNAFRRFLDCGILAKGFARVRCPYCGFDTAVAFCRRARAVPVVRGPANGRHRHASGGSGDPSRAGPPVGAQRAAHGPIHSGARFETSIDSAADFRVGDLP
ncbi:MAG: transposase zinc-binding domain-containing protein [Planctomycetes bacterium]|nr:transposase zinc-binding domain-containing protein [Planctomycetota bacterium]